MKRLTGLVAPLLFAIALCPLSVFAEDEDSAMDDVEKLFMAEEGQADAVGPYDKKLDEVSEKKQPIGDIKDLSDLVKLSPFEDVAMIQRRYLPKTKRFELFGGLSGVLNDAFFLGVGASGRFGYNFMERYGIEGVLLLLNTSERAVTEDLRDKRGVLTQSLISAESYYGLDLKYTPVYGKMAFDNRSITPFDLYFSLGFGLTSTNQGTSEPTLHLGTGQIFARSKSVAFRWDFSWNFFQAESKVSARKESSMYNNLLLSLGMSFFYPEATYR